MELSRKRSKAHVLNFKLVKINRSDSSAGADKADMVILADRGRAESLQSVTAGFSLGHALVIAVAGQLGTRSLAFLNAIDAMEEESLSAKVRR